MKGDTVLRVRDRMVEVMVRKSGRGVGDDERTHETRDYVRETAALFVLGRRSW